MPPASRPAPRRAQGGGKAPGGSARPPAPRRSPGAASKQGGGLPLTSIGVAVLFGLVVVAFLMGRSLVAGTSETVPTEPTRLLARATSTPASRGAAFAPVLPPTTATTPPGKTGTVTASPTRAAPGAPTPTATAVPRASATTAATATRPPATPTAATTATPLPKPAAPVDTRQPERIAAPTATSAPARPTGAPATQQGSKGVVALTFDAGADRGYAEDILDRLQEEGIPASFGITGTWARAHPDLVRRMAAEGHLMINHTLTHRSFTGLSDNQGGLTAAQRRAELDNADTIIAPLIGRSTKPWYRLPYGDDDTRVAGDVAAAGYTRKAGWTVDSYGWRGITAAEIVERCLRLAAPNAVYVMHVGRSSQDGPALKAIVDGLRARGYGFATMANLP